MASRAVEHRCFILRVKQDGSSNVDVLNKLLEKEQWQMFEYSEFVQPHSAQGKEFNKDAPADADLITIYWLRRPLPSYEADFCKISDFDEDDE